MSAWDVRVVDQDYAEIRIPSPLGLETFVVHAGVAHHLASRHNADVARPSLTQQQLEASAARVLAGAVRELLWGLAPSWLRKRRRA